MTSRALHAWVASGAVALAAAAAATLPPPPSAGAHGTLSPRVFAALASAGLVALGAAALRLGRGGSRRLLAPAIAGLSLALGVAAFLAYTSASRACITQYDGRIVVIGTEWTPLGERYSQDNPGLSNAEILFDSAGAADRLWTSQSIDRCRSQLSTTYMLWVPCLVVCLLAAAHALPSSPLAIATVAAPAPRAPRAADAPPTYDVFISYRHGGQDGEFARTLLLALEGDGYRVAIDERDFPANASVLLEMERCVRESRFTVSLLSPRYLGSGHCEEEAVLCKVLDMGDRKRRLIPMIIAPVELPAWLFGLVGIDCTKPDPLVDPFDRLRSVLGPPLSTRRIPESARGGV